MERILAIRPILFHDRAHALTGTNPKQVESLFRETLSPGAFSFIESTLDLGSFLAETGQSAEGEFLLRRGVEQIEALRGSGQAYRQSARRLGQTRKRPPIGEQNWRNKATRPVRDDDGRATRAAATESKELISPSTSVCRPAALRHTTAMKR